MSLQDDQYFGALETEKKDYTSSWLNRWKDDDLLNIRKGIVGGLETSPVDLMLKKDNDIISIKSTASAAS